MPAPLNATYDASGSLVITVDGLDAPVVYDLGSMAFMSIGAVLVMIMGPAIGLIYSGMLRQKNALSMIWMALAIYSVGTIQWFLFGYSFAFSTTGSSFIGNFKFGGIVNTMELPSSGNAAIPSILYFFYQAQFASVTPVIYSGGFAERARLWPVLVFTFFWATLVYDPVARWVWNSNGWLFKLGDLDFAGGGPVHQTSGAAALAISLFLGKRKGYGTSKLSYRASNISNTAIGTFILWFGWFGFNGGSELALNLRSVNALVVTNIAAAAGGLTWMAVDSIYNKKISTISFCSGVIAGLVGITPAAGYVGAPASIAIGCVTAIVSNFGTGFSKLVGIDDALDIFATHGIAGACGSLMTALFADSYYSTLDGYGVGSGWINQHYIQLAYNLCATASILAWSFTVSYILLTLINLIPGLHFRASEEAEAVGIDLAYGGEQIYCVLPHSEDREADDFMLEERSQTQPSTPDEKKRSVADEIVPEVV